MHVRIFQRDGPLCVHCKALTSLFINMKYEVKSELYDTNMRKNGGKPCCGTPESSHQSRKQHGWGWWCMQVQLSDDFVGTDGLSLCSCTRSWLLPAADDATQRKKIPLVCRFHLINGSQLKNRIYTSCDWDQISVWARPHHLYVVWHNQIALQRQCVGSGYRSHITSRCNYVQMAHTLYFCFNWLGTWHFFTLFIQFGH